MKLLAIDVGNSHTVFGLFKGKTPRWVRRVETRKALGLFRKIWLKQVDAIAVSSVVPALDLSLRSLLKKKFGRIPLFVNHRIRLPIRIRLKNRQGVGADRIVNAVAAYSKYRRKGGHAGPPLLVIDFGTATTFDVVTAKGEFVGGAITPGLKTAAEALSEKCAKLPKVSTLSTQRTIGRSTVEAMRSGIFLGYASLVEGMIGRFKKKLGPNLKVIATGGLAPQISPAVPGIDKVDPHLTLQGLRILYEANRK